MTSLNFPTERLVTPTASDLYCAGFVSKPIHTHHQFVTGGLESPFTTRFANGEAVYLWESTTGTAIHHYSRVA